MQNRNRQYIKRIFIAVSICVIFVYGYYEFRGFLYGPELVIESPADGFKTTSPVVDIKGSTKRISKITLNDSPIFIDETGVFSEKIALVPGHNFISITVTDRFEKTKTSVVEVIYSPTHKPTPIETMPPEATDIDEDETTLPDAEIE